MSETPKLTARIAIVGAGQVGAAVSYALILGSIASEILLVDTRVDWRDGQVRDLSDASYSGNSNTRVRPATYREASQCDIVVITAGSKCNIGKETVVENRAGLPFPARFHAHVLFRPDETATCLPQCCHPSECCQSDETVPIRHDLACGGQPS
jgi:hypothetical protein